MNDSNTIGFYNLGNWHLLLKVKSVQEIKKIKIRYETKHFDFPRSQWTRLGVTASFLLELESEINSGEALDFFLGLIGLDLYKDDVLYLCVYNTR